jgi:uncharacterized membrane protein
MRALGVSLRTSVDVLLALAIGLVALAVVVELPASSANVVRVAIAIGAVLFVPGYMSLAALYPHPEEVMPHERAALAFGFSLAVVSLVGLALNFSPWGIRAIPFMSALGLWDATACGVTILRRRGRARISGTVSAPAAARLRATRLVLPAACLAAAALGAAAVVALLGTPRQEQFTEFYLQSPAGSFPLPGPMLVNGAVSVRLTVANREGSAQRYRIEPGLGERRLPSIEVGGLRDGAAWERVLSFQADTTTGRTTLRFDLYRGSEAKPFRSLALQMEIPPR